MNIKRHCDLCEHQVLNLKEGTICDLTNKKPNFNKTCLKINFDKKIKTELENLLVDLEIEKTKKRQIISNLIFNSLFGIIIMAGGFFLIKITLPKLNRVYVEYVWFLSLVVASGYFLFKKPFVELASYKKVIRNINYELFKIEEVLKLYSVTYKDDIEILKEVHGTQEYSFDIKLIK